MMKTLKIELILPVIFCCLILNESRADFKFICPPNVTINCTEDYLHDLNVYGRAYTDYNGIISNIHDCGTIIELDECGAGTIKRTWTTENPENWEWLSCTQVITISNLNGFSYADIQWPLSLTIESCDPQLDLKNLTEPYDMPRWARPKCAKPMLSYKDTRVRVSPSCEKILREWKVLNWCLYDPISYPGRGLFSYTQVIKLITTSDQISISCPLDTIVINSSNCDTVFVKLDSALLHSPCPVYHSITNNSPYSLSKGNNASGYYPVGKSSFEYFVEYACGKEAKCTVVVEVRSSIKPTPYCLTGVVIALMPVDTDLDGIIDNGMVEVWASDLDKGSWHSCPAQRLNFSFSPDVSDRSRTFTCSERGINQVEIWVTDTLGNQDRCKTTIEVQNNNPNIPNCNTIKGNGVNSLTGQSLMDQKTDQSGHLSKTMNRSGMEKSSPDLHDDQFLIQQRGDYLFILSNRRKTQCQLELFALNGERVHKSQFMLNYREQAIKLPSVLNGLYVYRLNTDKLIYSGKILKN